LNFKPSGGNHEKEFSVNVKPPKGCSASLEYPTSSRDSETQSDERRASEVNTHKLRKACVSMGVLTLSIILFTSNAFPWGSATHAYIDDQIGSKLPLKNLNEIYGGMAPDIFNFYPEVLVSGTAYNYLYIQTHYNSLALWSEAQGEMKKALAFGFASHANGQVGSFYAGADFTAHGPGGNDAGYYVIDKATNLWNILKPQLAAQGIFLDDLVGLSVSHNIIEFAIDIMVVYEMPGGSKIGKKVIDSALFRNPNFPRLLAESYAEGLSSTFGMSALEAAKMIISAERDFRKTILVYGQGLVQKSEGDAITFASSLLAQMGSEIYGITVDPALVAGAIMGAQALCRPDYVSAIQGTVNFVRTEMANAGISY
jgi:hypothetical protein